MERLEAKRVKGHTYYYYSKWARGKNKQGRDNLRQVSYALSCAADGQLPLFYDVYEGNRNDARQFGQVLRRFHRFFRQLSALDGAAPETTLVFDKGNNSADCNSDSVAGSRDGGWPGRCSEVALTIVVDVFAGASGLRYQQQDPGPV